jgi:hypothetical protein
MNKLFSSIRVRVFEMATGEHSFLAGVEGYGSEFLPVAYGGVFDYEFVDGEFTLVVCQFCVTKFWARQLDELNELGGLDEAGRCRTLSSSTKLRRLRQALPISQGAS